MNYLIFSILCNLIAEATNRGLASSLNTDRCDELMTVLDICITNFYDNRGFTPFEHKEAMAALRIIPVDGEFRIFAVALNVKKTYEIENFFKGCSVGSPYNSLVAPYYARLASLNELSDVFRWALDRAADVKFEDDENHEISRVFVD